MKKYIQSFRLFFGSAQIRSLVIFSAVIIGVTTLCGLTAFFPVNDFLIGFGQGVSSMLGAICAIFGLIFLNATYQYLSPAIPGHKYFASLPDGAKHFRRAIAVGNAVGIVVGLALISLISIVYALLGVDMGIVLFSSSLLFVETGVCDLTGYIRNNTARVLAMLGVTCLFGFFMGFTDGMNEADGISAIQMLMKDPGIIAAVMGVSAAVFIAGLIYSLAMAEKKWGESR